MNRTLTNSYLSSFCLELAMLLQVGIAPYEGVMMLWKDEPDKDGKAVLQSLIDSLEKAAPLSGALRESGYFPRYMVNLTEAGEKTGCLAETLKALSEHYDRQERLSLAIKNAVLYPAILLVMMTAVVLILIIRVLPMFDEVFARMGGQMPAFAVRLMQFGGWIADASAVIAVIAAAVIVIALAVWLSPSARGALMNLLGGRGLFWRIASARFASVMAMAVASGLNPEESSELAAAVSGGSKAVDKKLNRCTDLLRSGGTLAEAMFGAGILSAQNSRMLSIGSRSGMTDTVMAEIAARCERDTQDELNRIIGMVEPALVIIASVTVGVILLSVMLPLMSIMTAIG